MWTTRTPAFSRGWRSRRSPSISRRTSNQDGARLLADDALGVLPEYRPAHMGVEVAPVLKTLKTLRPLLDGLDTEADCPMQPFVFNKLIYHMEAQ